MKHSREEFIRILATRAKHAYYIELNFSEDDKKKLDELTNQDNFKKWNNYENPKED